MFLGAMLHAGLPEETLRAEVGKLGLDGYTLGIDRVVKQGISSVDFSVSVADQKAHRHLKDILAIIHRAGLPQPVKDRASAIFLRLAEAEAAVHGTTIYRVHFHEVGAVDAIVDIVGAAIAVHQLRLDRIVCSPIPTGHGTVSCAHGVMPLPAPATAKLLELAGAPLASCDEPGELTTPTGAAVVTILADEFGPPPAMRIERIGYGAGDRDGRTRPNVLRVMIGSACDGGDADDQVMVLEANLDDATGQQIGCAFDALFEAGALDVFATAIQMKKNRPGVLLSVLTTINRAAACEDALFRQTTTFGVRRHVSRRTKMSRDVQTVETAFGPIRVKIGLREGRVQLVAPEYDDCAAAARAGGASLHEVMFAAESAWRNRKASGA
jgi:hypothetical protein